MSLSDILDVKTIPKYFEFLIDFARSPRATLQPYSGKKNIDPMLLTFSVAGTILSIIESTVFSITGAVGDQSKALSVISSIDSKLLPVICLIAVFLTAIIFHIINRIINILSPFL